MARVRITVETGSSTFEGDREAAETMAEAYGPDKSIVDQLLDASVAAIKRAYWAIGEESK